MSKELQDLLSELKDEDDKLIDIEKDSLLNRISEGSLEYEEVNLLL